MISILDTGIEIPYKDSIAFNNIANQLVGEGFAVDKGSSFFIKKEDLFVVDSFYKQWLGIPSSYDGRVKLRLEGAGLLHVDSKIVVDFIDDANEITDLDYEGFMIRNKEGKAVYTASKELTATLELVDRYNALADKISDNLAFKYVAKIKEVQAKDDNIEIDDFLERQEILFPDKLHIEVETGEDSVTLKPTINSIDDFPALV